MEQEFIIENGVLKEYKGPGGDVVIPEGVTSIGKEAFGWCRSPRSVTIPESVKSIGDLAFRGCKSLTSITISEGVTSIGGGAFYDCSSLTSATIPESVTSIGESAFKSCNSLADAEGYIIVRDVLYGYCGSQTSITIPAGVTTISNGAFEDCSSLTSVTIPEGVTSIGIDAFKKCTNLSSVNIPESVTSIGKWAFNSCSRLTDAEGFIILQGVLYDYCGSRKNVTIPEGVTSIGNHAFDGHTSLTSVMIPEGVTSIGEEAFSWCRSLTSITIPEGVTSIGDRAFNWCRSLTSVTIPESVTSIGDSAFYLCDSLLWIKSPILINHNNLWTNIALISNRENKLSFFAYTAKKQSDIITDYAHAGAWTFYDQELINNGPKYKHSLHERLIGALGRLLEPEELTENNRELLSALIKKNIKKYIPIAETLRCPEIIKALFDLGFVNKQNEKTIRKLLKNSVLLEISNLVGTELSENTIKSGEQSGDKSISTSPLEEEYNTKYRAINGEFFFKSMKLAGMALPDLYLKDGTPAPTSLFNYIFVSYCLQIAGDRSSGRKSLIGFDMEADEAAALLSESSLSDAIDCLSLYDATAYPAIIPLVCRFGNETQVQRLIKSWGEWGKWDKYNIKGRTAQNALVESIILSDTRNAALFADKRKILNRYAAIRRTTEEVIRERFLSDVGLEKDGSKSYDLGNQKAVIRMQKDFSFLVELSDTGKTMKSLPKKGADPEKYNAASKDFSEIKKSVNKIIKNRRDLLFNEFLERKGKSADDWKAAYLDNPILRRIASLLVWKQGNNSFTLKDTEAINREEHPYNLGEEDIYLAHPMEMEQTELLEWQKYFAKHALKQPFAQIWEPVIPEDSVQPDRYNGAVLPLMKLIGKEKHGIIAEGFTAYSEEYWVDFKDCFLELEYSSGRLNPEGYDKYTCTLGAFAYQNYTRYTNHIVGLLDSWTVETRLLKDDVSVIDQMSDFTLAQILDFIMQAASNNCPNVTAALLAYKNERFEDYGAVESLLLEE